MRLVYMGAPRGGESVCGLWQSSPSEELPIEVVIGEFTGCTGAILAEYDTISNLPERILAVHCQCNKGVHALGAVRKFVQESRRGRSINGVVIGSYSREIELAANRAWSELSFDRKGTIPPMIINVGGQMQRGGIPDQIPHTIGFSIPDRQIHREYIVQDAIGEKHIRISGRVFENITEQSELDQSELDDFLRVIHQAGAISPGILVSARQHTRKVKKTPGWAQSELTKFEDRIRQNFIEQGTQTLGSGTFKRRGMDLLQIGVGLANEYYSRIHRWHGKRQMLHKLYATIELCNLILDEIDGGNADTDVISNTIDLDTRYPEWSSGFFTSRCKTFASQVFNWVQGTRV